MPRNFHRRVEVMFPIEAADLKRRILKEVLPTYLRDNLRARILQPDGSYTRVHPAEGQAAHRSQEEFLTMRDSVTDRIAVAADNGSGNGASAAHVLEQAAAKPTSP
jgi:polyphosphate kinase